MTAAQDSRALKPCPFCGSTAHFDIDDDNWEWVECSSCGMQGNRSASLMEDCKPKLAEAWNRRAAMSAELTEEREAADNWRRLALQFDGHRMQALWHLKRILHADSSVDEYKAAEAFLEAPPLDGEAVLSQRITALYADAVAAKPLAYLVERHAFRASPHGQDAEGNSWLEECQPTEPGAFPVYAAPQPRAFQTADGAQERKPLTDAQIDDLHGEANRGFDIEHANYLKAFRDAERAHGITGEHST